MQHRNKRTAAGVIGALAGGGAIAVTMVTGGGAAVQSSLAAGGTTSWGAMVRVVHAAEDSVSLITGRALARPPYNDGVIPVPGGTQAGG